MKANAVIRALEKGRCEQISDNALLVPGSNIIISGEYYHSVNGKDHQTSKNLLPEEGIHHILDSALGNNAAQITQWYMALHINTTAPVGTNTMSNYESIYNELKSQSEGYVELARPQWIPTASVAGATDNYGARAVYTIATATNVTVGGCALMSSSPKASAAGVLASITSFDPNPRVLYDGDEFNLGYRISLTSS